MNIKIIQKYTKYLMFFISTTVCLLLNLTFAMPANAYDITTPVQPTGRSWSADNTIWWTTLAPDTGGYYTKTETNTRAIFLNKGNMPNKQVGASHILNAIQTGTISAEYGKYYLIKINYTFQNKSTSSTFPSIVRIVTSGQPAYTLMSTSIEYTPCTQWRPEMPTTSSYTPTQYDNSCTWGGVIYNIIVQARDSGNFPIQLGLSNTDMLKMYIAEFTSNTNLNIGTISIEDIMEFDKVQFGENIANDVNNQQTQAGEQAQTDGQQGANTSGQQAEQTGTSLLSVFTGFVGAMSAINPSNCNLTGDMGHINLGVINFCKDPVPIFVQIIGSIIIILMLVPLSIHLAKRMINLFRSFTNG